MSDYIRHTWQDGEPITKEKMNNLEDGVAGAHNLVLQALGVEDCNHPGCFYRVVDGETEWINPPMEEGEDYRTTERWLGEPVYTTLLYMGEAYFGSYFVKEINTKIKNVVRAVGVAGDIVFPCIYQRAETEDGYVQNLEDVQLHIYKNTNANGVTVTFNADDTGPCYVQVWYTKLLRRPVK